MIRTRTPAIARSTSPRGLLLVALGLALTASGAGLAPRAHGAGAGPSAFYAVYQVRFLGLTIGEAKVHGNLTGTAYGIRSETKLSFLKGVLFKLKLGASASGRVAADGPHPAGFALDVETKKNRKGHLSMAFRDNAVSQVVTRPTLRPSPNAIPVKAEHMRGVLDPLSAMFVGGRSARNGLDPKICERRLPIFDGRHRFDVQLSHIQSVNIERRGRSGYAGPALVCGATYVPIAGYRPDNKGVVHMSRTTGIRAWLIPVPQANQVLPYRVVLPTPWGEASAIAKLIQLDWNGSKRVALVR